MFSNLYLETLFLKRHGLMFDAHQERSVVNSEVSFDLGLIRFLVLESVAALPDRQTRGYTSITRKQDSVHLSILPNIFNLLII
jgi:hypothetical protein